jgi:uracil phosphoribosyltransferase
MIYELTKTASIANHYMEELRNIEVQVDRMRFRKNLERLGQIFAFEISKKLNYKNRKVRSVLGECDTLLCTDRIVLATILRAGLPLYNGLQTFFDKADSAFVSAYRKHNEDGSFQISLQYITCPDLAGSVLIISDPMLATGASLRQVIDAMKKYGMPSEIHIVTVIAAQQGIDYISAHYPNAHIWVGSIDPELNSKSYIVPGLGDAGDLAFGEKLQA